MFLGIAVAVVVITILLAAVATIQRGIARKERERAEQRTREVSQSLSRSDFLEATRRLAADETGATLAHLARARCEWTRKTGSRSGGLFLFCRSATGNSRTRPARAERFCLVCRH